MSNEKPSTTEYHFEHLTDYLPDVVGQIEAIYDVSFPPYERKPFWLISDAMQAGNYSVFIMRVISGETNQVVGFALLRPLRTSQAMYIEYFAVAPALRGRGIGSTMFRSMLAFLSNISTSALIWEVDPPEKADDLNTRRVKFYERFGGKLIEQSKQYGMPNYFKGSGMLPLRLMWKPLRSEHEQPTKPELIAFIRDIYETEYPRGDSVRDEILAKLDKD